jgi:hypothetical protein
MKKTIIEEAAGPIQCCNKASGGLRALGTRGISTFKAWRQHRDQEALEKALARNIETANGHQAKGMPRGSQVYLALWIKANDAIDHFCEKWHVDPTLIEAEAPALRELKNLTIPDKSLPLGFKLFGSFIGGILFLILIGAASGLVNAGHNWVMQSVAHFIH